MNNSAEILIAHAHLLTMAGTGVGYIADGAVAINGGKIVAVGTTADLTAIYHADTIIDATGQALLPGLIDGHMHTPYAVVRGVAQDVANWMQLGLAPYYKHMDKDAMLAGTRLAVLEGVRNGTTTFGDYSFPHDGWAEIFDAAGVRARLTARINALPKTGMAGLKVGDLYPLSEDDGKESIAIATRFAQTWSEADNSRISVMLGPQAPDMISTDQLLECKRIGQRMGLMLHLHTAQGDREIDQMVKRFGMRTPAYLSKIGMLDEQLLAVHLTEATDSETEQIAASGASMALCSGSIGLIDGIVPPAHVFRQAGGHVALGSDQAAGNNCHNIFNEMKLTALFNKIKFRDPTIMPAWELLRMATIEGARAIGLGDQIGSIEIGKQADIILIDVTESNLLPILQTPLRTIVPNLVYSATGREVTTVIVAGKVVMDSGVVLTMDGDAIRHGVQREAERVAANVAADPIHKSMALLQPMEAGKL